MNHLTLCFGKVKSVGALCIVVCAVVYIHACGVYACVCGVYACVCAYN